MCPMLHRSRKGMEGGLQKLFLFFFPPEGEAPAVVTFWAVFCCLYCTCCRVVGYFYIIAPLTSKAGNYYSHGITNNVVNIPVVMFIYLGSEKQEHRRELSNIWLIYVCWKLCANFFLCPLQVISQCVEEMYTCAKGDKRNRAVVR